MKQTKIWGTTELKFKNDNFEVHRLEIKSNSYCSEHYHRFKYNLFVVESGSLVIKTWNENGTIDTTLVLSGEKTSVAPGICHQFVSGEQKTIAYEIYYTEPIGDDIIRRTVGGNL